MQTPFLPYHMQGSRHQPGWDCQSTYIHFIAWHTEKCHQDREIGKTKGAVPLPSLWQESNVALLTCRGPLRNSESTTGLRKTTHHNKYYMDYRSLPSLLEANTTAAERVSCSKWRWEPGHKLHEQQHCRGPAALQTGTASGQGSATQGCRGKQGQFSSAHKKYCLPWSSQLKQQPFILCTALEGQNLKPESTRQFCRLPLLQASSSDSLRSSPRAARDNTHWQSDSSTEGSKVWARARLRPPADYRTGVKHWGLCLPQNPWSWTTGGNWIYIEFSL